MVGSEMEDGVYPIDALAGHIGVSQIAMGQLDRTVIH
jgi:hypothetical protein